MSPLRLGFAIPVQALMGADCATSPYSASGTVRIIGGSSSHTKFFMYDEEEVINAGAS